MVKLKGGKLLGLGLGSDLRRFFDFADALVILRTHFVLWHVFYVLSTYAFSLKYPVISVKCGKLL